MRTLLAVTSVALFACTLAWLVPFYCICAHGTHTIYEPNTLILSVEVATFILFMCIAVVGMIYSARKRG